MHADTHAIIAAGRSEADRMKAAVAQAAPEDRVTMRADQFSRLAALVESLCALALDGDRGGFGDARYWVPLPEYAKLRREAQRLAAQAMPVSLRIDAADLPARH